MDISSNFLRPLLWLSDSVLYIFKICRKVLLCFDFSEEKCMHKILDLILFQRGIGLLQQLQIRPKCKAWTGRPRRKYLNLIEDVFKNG